MNGAITLDRLERASDEFERRGRSSRALFPELHLIQTDISARALDRKAARRAGKLGRADRLTEEITRLRSELRAAKRDLLEADILEVESLLLEPHLIWELERISGLPGKPAFRPKRKTRRHEFARHLTTEDVRRSTRVRAQSRNVISNALLDNLKDGAPKIVVRTDIESFFESVPHDALLRRLANLGRCSSITLRSVESLLAEYRDLSKSVCGLPRGVSISASLAEIYVQELDYRLMMDSGLVHYSRFVDDIVAVFSISTPKRSQANVARARVTREITRLGLRANAEKTRAFAVPPRGSRGKREIDFLGYKYLFDGAKCRVDLSDKRVDRMSTRLDRAFASFSRSSRGPDAESQLFERVRLLTSNYKLQSANGRSYVGIAFSSPLVDHESPGIVRLDQHLAQLNSDPAIPHSLATRLGDLTFSSGIEHRRFIRVSARRLRRLALVWRDV